MNLRFTTAPRGHSLVNQIMVIWAWGREFNYAVAAQPDEPVWSQQGNVCFEQPNSSSATLQYTVPIHDEKGTAVVGAAVAVVDLASVFSEASRGLQTKTNQQSMVVVLDRSGNTLYHSDRLNQSERYPALIRSPAL